jgi:uncharacterized membrane protein YfcA
VTVALFGALAIGLSLGLLGSGGSILTVPILVYLVGQPDKVAIAGSLAIVGGISLFGALPYALQRQVAWRSVVLFGAPGMAGAFVGAFLAQFVSGAFQLLLFAVIMLVAALFMFRGKREELEQTHERHAWWKIGLEGLAVGVVTGLVGVGGGFLIVPALAQLGGLPMHIAVGTSLLIIALKSFVGFFEYLQVLGELNLRVDWTIVAVFTGIGVVGSFLGNRLGARVQQDLLKRAFAVFLVVVGAFILWQNAAKVV